MGVTSVLLLDDNDEIRETLADLLREDGYDVVASATAEGAVAAALTRPFDRALLDWRLDARSRAGVREVVAALPASCRVAVLSAWPPAALEAAALGVDHLTKPLDWREFGAFLRGESPRQPQRSQSRESIVTART